MDDLSQKLNQILSDPNSMAQIQNMMGSLGLGGQSPAPSPTAGNNDSMAGIANILSGLGGGNSAPSTNNNDTMAGLSSMLSGLGAGNSAPPTSPAIPGGTDMIMALTKLAPILGKTREEDDSTRLLLALKPMLSEARRKKIDEAMKILQMMRLLPLLKDSGVFSSLLGGLL